MQSGGLALSISVAPGVRPLQRSSLVILSWSTGLGKGHVLGVEGLASISPSPLHPLYTLLGICWPVLPSKYKGSCHAPHHRPRHPDHSLGTHPLNALFRDSRKPCSIPPCFWQGPHPWGQTVFSHFLNEEERHTYTDTHTSFFSRTIYLETKTQTYKYCFVFVFTRNWLIIGVSHCHRTELNSYLGLKHFSKERVCRDAPLLPHCKDDLSIHAQASLASSSHKASEPGTPEEGLCRTHITTDL